MQRFFATISPRFLRNLDHQLLINRPFLWATRIHHVLYWALLGNIFAACYAYLLPISVESQPSPWSGTLVLILPVLIGLVFWGKSLQDTGYWQHQKTVPQKTLLRNQTLFGFGSLLLSVIPILYFLIVESRLQNGFVFAGGRDVAVLLEQWILIIFPVVWMVVELFAYLRWGQILWGFVIGMGLIVLESMVLGLVLSGSGSNSGIGVLILLLLVQLFAFVVTGYNSAVKSNFGRTWQSLCLVFASLILLIFPMVFFTAISINSGSRFDNFSLIACWLIGLTLAGSIWHLGFRKRIMEIQAQPDK